MSRFANGDELAETCRTMLAASSLYPEEIVGSRDGPYEWGLLVRIGERRFDFGTVSRDGYYFIEQLDGGKVIDYLSGTSQPIFESNDKLWRMSFNLLRSAIADPQFRGPTQPVV